jgi:hypothetical protein
MGGNDENNIDHKDRDRVDDRGIHAIADDIQRYGEAQNHHAHEYDIPVAQSRYMGDHVDSCPNICVSHELQHFYHPSLQDQQYQVHEYEQLEDRREMDDLDELIVWLRVDIDYKGHVLWRGCRSLNFYIDTRCIGNSTK